MPRSSPRLVVAVDLDGTLVDAHTTGELVWRLSGVRGLPRLSASVLSSALLPPRPSRVKPAALAGVLRGRAIGEVRDIGARFAEELVAHRLRPGMAATVAAHRAMGAEIVMVTAGLDVVAEPIAERLPFDHVIATRVLHEDGRCTGAVEPHDLTGPTKVRRLCEWLDATAAVHDDRPLWLQAYGDSSGDDEMRELAAATERRLAS